MNLINTEYQIDISLIENEVNVLTIENPKVYTSIINNLWNQCDGNPGTWILSENEKIYNITKTTKCIINPFCLDVNERIIINKLYQELKLISDESLVDETSKLNVSIIDYLDNLINEVSYSLKYNIDFNLLNLLKIYDVKINIHCDTFLEKIIEYLRVMNKICNINIFVFVGLKQYLSEEEMKQLYEFVFYEKMHLVLIEGKQYSLLNNENLFIMDKDFCIINTGSEK